MVSIGKLLVVLSGGLFLLGSTFLAYSIKFQSELLSKDDNSEFTEKIRKMGSPGRIDSKQFKAGMIFNTLGYVSLLISTLISP